MPSILKAHRVNDRANLLAAGAAAIVLVASIPLAMALDPASLGATPLNGSEVHLINGVDGPLSDFCERMFMQVLAR